MKAFIKLQASLFSPPLVGLIKSVLPGRRTGLVVKRRPNKRILPPKRPTARPASTSLDSFIQAGIDYVTSEAVMGGAGPKYTALAGAVADYLKSFLSAGAPGPVPIVQEDANHMPSVDGSTYVEREVARKAAPSHPIGDTGYDWRQHPEEPGRVGIYRDDGVRMGCATREPTDSYENVWSWRTNTGSGTFVGPLAAELCIDAAGLALAKRAGSRLSTDDKAEGYKPIAADPMTGTIREAGEPAQPAQEASPELSPEAVAKALSERQVRAEAAGRWLGKSECVHGGCAGSDPMGACRGWAVFEMTNGTLLCSHCAWTARWEPERLVIRPTDQKA